MPFGIFLFVRRERNIRRGQPIDKSAGEIDGGDVLMAGLLSIDLIVKLLLRFPLGNREPASLGA
jgi:hypothetical protein